MTQWSHNHPDLVGSEAEGFCACGCGQRTPIASRNDTQRGCVKGAPLPLVPGHRRGTSAVKYLEDANGCWIWQRAVYSNGYGQNNHRLAHRVAYEEAYGPIPDGQQLDHLCRVRPCCNPEHLEPVTNAENSQRGSKAKLTVGAVHEIRRSSDTAAALAARFGVQPAAVDKVRNGSRWSNV